MNDEKVKFQSKAEIAHAIQVLTPFALSDKGNVVKEDSCKKVQELIKLL